MPELGRAALVVCFGLAALRGRRRLLGAHTAAAPARRARPRTRSSPPSRGDARRLGRAARRARAQRLLLHATSRSTRAASCRRRTSWPSFWGGQEGSLLLWLLVLTGYGAAAVLLDRKAGRELVAWVVPVLGVVAAFFSMLVVFVASPFHTQLAPADGAGLNPSLQSPYFQIHPPLLYLGYVGLTVPFAFAMGALLSGRTDERWIVATRRWTLAAWMFLGDRPAARRQVGVRGGGLGRLLRLGPGRERGADAVARRHRVPPLGDGAGEEGDAEGLEHAARHPRVLAVAVRDVPDAVGRAELDPLVHGGLDRAVVPRLHLLRRRLLRCAARSSRACRCCARRRKLESLVSREATFLYNNLLLVALCLTILWGVTFPILSEAVRGEAVTVGRPYYDFFLRAFGLPLLLLMGIGPLIAWRRASLSLARSGCSSGRPPSPSRSGVVLIAAGAGSSIPGLIAYTFSAFVAATIVLEFARGTRPGARSRASPSPARSRR